MLALIRLIHCLNCVNVIPDHHSMYANLLSCSSMTLTSDEFQQNLKNSIAGIQEIYGNIEDNVDDSGFLKYCFSEILQSLWSLPDTDTEKGKIMHYTCYLKIFLGSYSIYRPRIHGYDKNQVNFFFLLFLFSELMLFLLADLFISPQQDMPMTVGPNPPCQLSL